MQNVIKLSQNCPKMFCKFPPRTLNFALSERINLLRSRTSFDFVWELTIRDAIVKRYRFHIRLRYLVYFCSLKNMYDSDVNITKNKTVRSAYGDVIFHWSRARLLLLGTEFRTYKPILSLHTSVKRKAALDQIYS